MGLLHAIIFTLSFAANGVPASEPALDTPYFSYQTSSSEEVVLHLKPTLVSGTTVSIGYEITYPGYIEFHLYNPEGEKIWITSAIKEKGEHIQSLRRDKLSSGEIYTFEFFYKGQRFPGSFSL